MCKACIDKESIKIFTDQKNIYISSSRREAQFQKVKALTTKGKSHEIPLPFCLAAIVVGPERDGIQKKPSVRSPLKFE